MYLPTPIISDFRSPGLVHNPTASGLGAQLSKDSSRAGERISASYILTGWVPVLFATYAHVYVFSTVGRGKWCRTKPPENSSRTS